MKKFLGVLTGIVAAGISVASFAAMTEGATAPTGPGAAMTGGPGAQHPCHAIEEACKSAGFTKGGAAGKGLFKDCLMPVMSGKSVAGVNVSAEEIQGCQAKKAQMEQHKGQGGQMPAQQ